MVAMILVRRMGQRYRVAGPGPGHVPAGSPYHAPVELLLIRHARPLRLELDEGPADPALDPVGVAQAEALAGWLADERLDALYTSPLRRARETAAPVAERLGLVSTVADGVAEWDRDASSYIPTEELPVAAPEVWAAMTGGDWEALGIDLPAFLHRVTTTLDGIAADHRGQRVAVVCHGGVINAWAARVLGLDRTLFFEPDYTSCSRFLVSSAGQRSVRSLNETAHLPRR